MNVVMTNSSYKSNVICNIYEGKKEKYNMPHLFNKFPHFIDGRMMHRRILGKKMKSNNQITTKQNKTNKYKKYNYYEKMVIFLKKLKKK